MTKQERNYGWRTDYSRDDFLLYQCFQLLYLFCLFCFSVVSAKFIASLKLTWFPEVAFIIFFGVCASFISWLANYSDSVTDFDPSLFFTYLLPPIIFSSGLQLNLKMFQENYFEILLFASIGTYISAIVIAVILYFMGLLKFMPDISFLNALSFGSLISATDPVSVLATLASFKVDPILYMFIYTVSVLDDAFAIILFETFHGLDLKRGVVASSIVLTVMNYMFVSVFGSVFIGSIGGYLFAFVYSTENSKPFRLTCALFAAYIPYLLASSLQISGIVAGFYSAIYFKKYLKLIGDYEISIDEGMSFFGNCCETFVFFCIGCSLFFSNYGMEDYHFNFSLWTLLACIIGRALFVYPLSLVVNIWHIRQRRRDNFIGNPDELYLSMANQHMIFAAGLRGPISYATSLIFDEGGRPDIYIKATKFVMLITTLFVGASQHRLMLYLGIKRGDENSIETEIQDVSPDENVDGIQATRQIEVSWRDVLNMTLLEKLEKLYLEPLLLNAVRKIDS